ncbi:rare lipoprotein A [Novosphingobium sp. PhB165]|uniref:septal ring lytic transglycosylase RlpA family protein n=1 Tax=Novosphingobium sp. PhB165 TaxID=2485105 RepID=UPI0010D8EF3C|nr:septal ring lytic transglycosylase RlpA family protein [Novosphingobium sp. PhB165]TCM19593.1 rare lipoprotein A [Novosphingobium sp. PhB165]
MTGKQNQPPKARAKRIGFALASIALIAAPASSAVAEGRLVKLPGSEPAAAEAPVAMVPPAALTPAPAALPATPLIEAIQPETQEFETIGSGMASFYGRELAGNRTASGDRFDPTALTAAHRTLPLGSQVRVTNPATGQSVIVTVNDRGPFHSNRLIDLSKAAADKIGISRAGSGKVEIAVRDDD